jgi:hypothetical protein
MKQKEWTIMIYMAGDNNLAVDMAYAMEQIKGVADTSADSPNLFVYYDGNSPAIPTMYCDFSEPGNPRYVRSFKVPKKLLKVSKKENENAADWRSVINFVDWCVNKVEVEDDDGEISFGRRANRYALIFSGHSLGFQDIGLFKDETSGKSMKMSDFGEMLHILTASEKMFTEATQKRREEDEDWHDAPTKLIGEKLAILGFDSCVMGMLEVGYQFEFVADTLIASEGSVPSAGWTYAKILGCLAQEDGKKLKTKEVAERFVKKFIQSQDAYTVGGVSVDMAAWDLTKFGGLMDAFDRLSQALLICFETEDHIYKQMERIILKVHWQCQSYMFDQNVDLGDFCELLDRECGQVADELGEGGAVQELRFVQEQCQNVLRQLKKAVILSGFSGGGYQYSNGISIFFPWSREGYEVSKKNYEGLLFVTEAAQKQLSWIGFLKKYLYDVSLRKIEDIVDGSKYRYRSGVKFREHSVQTTSASGTQRTKIAGHEGTKIAGHEGTKIAGHEGTKIAGHEGTKIAGHEGTKIAGHEGTKIAGHEGTKIAGHEGTKIAGHEGTKIAGHEGTKIAGHEGTKIAGHEGTKLAGGGGSSAFFNSLKLFKNIESRWDVSGFTKKPEETLTE